MSAGKESVKIQVSMAVLLSMHFDSYYLCLSDSGVSTENGEAAKMSAFICKADKLLYLEVWVEMETFQVLDAIEPC